MRIFWIPILVNLPIAYLQAPIPKTAAEAFDFVQQQRSKAEKLWRNGEKQGIDLLDEVLAYLDQPLIRDLAAGNRYLYARRTNIYLDLAEAYAIQGKTRECIDYLNKTASSMQSLEIAKFLEGSKSFDSIRQTSEFAGVLKKLRQYEQYWDSPSLDTLFQENLSDAEKVAGLSRFWSEVKYNFAYPEKLLNLDWDKMYLEAIPKVLATRSTLEYYHELMALCARLSDGHTNIYPPNQLNIRSIPPLRTGLIEGHVMILEVLSLTLEAQGIKAGTEITEIDGEPPIAYAKRAVEPYQSASTPQGLKTLTFGWELLRGPAQRPVNLKLLDTQGNTSDFEIARQGFPDVRRPLPLEFKMMPNGNIAYVALNDFGTEELSRIWIQIFPKLVDSKALIIDLRLNGGGSSGIGYDVLRSLVTKPFATSRSVMRRYNPTERAQNLLAMDWSEIPAREILPRDNSPYSKPVLLLAGPATASAAEDFLVAWKNSGRGPIIGEPSAGSTGQPLYFRLPGGGSARVCTKRDTFPDGREWVGIGITPDILVHPTVADVKAGKDTVLEKALRYIDSLK